MARSDSGPEEGSRDEDLCGDLPPPKIPHNTHTHGPCEPARVLTSLSQEDDVVQAWLEGPVPEVQGDVEGLALANKEAVRADLLRVVLHVVPGALEVDEGHLQPRDRTARARQKSKVVEPGPILSTTC